MIAYYIKLATFEYPRYQGDIRLEHPEILESQTGDSFPCPDTYAPVQYVDMPDALETQTIEAGPPVQDELGNWIASWVVRDLTPEEIQAAEQRPKFDPLKPT